MPVYFVCRRKASFNVQAVAVVAALGEGKFFLPLLCFSFELHQEPCLYATILMHAVFNESVNAAIKVRLAPDQKGSSAVFLASVLGVGL